MIDRSLVYSIGVKFTAPERPTAERQERLASAIVEALRREGVVFFVEDDNELVNIKYVKTIERSGRMQ